MKSVSDIDDLECGFACHGESRHASHIDNLRVVSVQDCGHALPATSGGNIPICRDVAGRSQCSGYRIDRRKLRSETSDNMDN